MARWAIFLMAHDNGLARAGFPPTIQGESFTEYLMRTNAHHAFLPHATDPDSAPTLASTSSLRPELVASRQPDARAEQVERLKGLLQHSLQTSGQISPVNAEIASQLDAFLHGDFMMRYHAANQMHAESVEREAARRAEAARDAAVRQRVIDQQREAERQLAETQERLRTAQMSEAALLSAGPEAAWHSLASGIETQDKLKAFFARRQPALGQRTLRILSAVKVVNEQRQRAFASASAFDIEPLDAHRQADTFLFHGCPQASASNIQTDGLLMRYAGEGMLGKGLYGAPDPRKSLQYCKGSPDGNFMFVCRFNVTAAKRAGPDTHHRNTVFGEFCVYDAAHVIVLWMIKVA